MAFAIMFYTQMFSLQDFCLLMSEKTKEMDPETHFKDTFRVFSKDDEGWFLVLKF